MKLVVLALLIFMPLSSFASIEIAFLEMRTYKGEIIQLEPNGQFAHVAISYGGKWLHAHPLRGVEIVSQESLEKIGKIKAIITISKEDKIPASEVIKLFGKPYDQSFSWSNEKIYCSELVAKLIRMAPEAMSFEATYWPREYQALNGQPGISPDDIFRNLKAQGYEISIPSTSCSNLFTH